MRGTSFAEALKRKPPPRQEPKQLLSRPSEPSPENDVGSSSKKNKKQKHPVSSRNPSNLEERPIFVKTKPNSLVDRTSSQTRGREHGYNQHPTFQQKKMQSHHGPQPPPKKKAKNERLDQYQHQPRHQSQRGASSNDSFLRSRPSTNDSAASIPRTDIGIATGSGSKIKKNKGKNKGQVGSSHSRQPFTIGDILMDDPARARQQASKEQKKVLLRPVQKPMQVASMTEFPSLGNNQARPSGWATGAVDSRQANPRNPDVALGKGWAQRPSAGTRSQPGLQNATVSLLSNPVSSPNHKTSPWASSQTNKSTMALQAKHSSQQSPASIRSPRSGSVAHSSVKKTPTSETRQEALVSNRERGAQSATKKRTNALKATASAKPTNIARASKSKAAGPKSTTTPKSKEKNGAPTSAGSGSSKAAGTPSLVASFFKAKQRDEHDNHDESALMAQFKIQLQEQKEISKGRQRLKPRKKKFTTLKKKILQERLDQWKEKVRNDAHSDATALAATGTILVLHDYASAEEVEDEDEVEELLSFVRDLAAKVGPLRDVYLPTSDEAVRNDTVNAYCWFERTEHAQAAHGTWNGLVLGGEPLNTSLMRNGDQPAKKLTSEDEFRQFVDSSLATEAASKVSSPTVRVRFHRILTEDDLEDDDCLQESLSDICGLFPLSDTESAGSVIETIVHDRDVILTISVKDEIQFQKLLDTIAKEKLGGETIQVSLGDGDDVEANKDSSSSDTRKDDGHERTVALTNVLTEDDMEDEDCLNETLCDLEQFVTQQHDSSNQVVSLHVVGAAVHVTLASAEQADAVVDQMNGMVLGGQIVNASKLQGTRFQEVVANGGSNTNVVMLENVLTEDDIEDEDCLAESLADLEELAQQFGGGPAAIESVKQDKHTPSLVRVRTSSPTIANAVFESFQGRIIGGQTVVASLPTSPFNGHKAALKSIAPTVAVSQETDPSLSAGQHKAEPMYSGDKLISERFAEMKRAPKIPSKPQPREYAVKKIVDDESVQPLLMELLGELMRLQKRAAEQDNNKNTKARRRLVIGLREVARGVRAHKVKMVCMANNVDEYGALDIKLQELLDLARSEAVPVFFEFNKRKLGKALGKNIKIAVVGIQNADGAHSQFKKLMQIAHHHSL